MEVRGVPSQYDTPFLSLEFSAQQSQEVNEVRSQGENLEQIPKGKGAKTAGPMKASLLDPSTEFE